MKRFLVCASVRGREKSLELLKETVQKRRPDAVLFAGGILDGPKQFAPHETAVKLTRNEVLFVEKFYKSLGGLGVFAAVIPGPGDIPKQDLLRMGMRAEVDCPGLHLVHATLVEKENVAICGLGELIVEDRAPQLESISRTMAEFYLRPLWSANQPCKILLLSSPPPGKLGGKDGNEFTGFFIDSFHPTLCVVRGGSDCRGFQRIAHTTVINPGALADGYAAWVDLSQNVDDQVELINFHEPPDDLDIGVGD